MALTLTLQSFLRPDASSVVKLISTAADGTQADGYSEAAMLSADGRHVVFSGGAGNLVPGDTNGTDDVFLVDIEHLVNAPAVLEGRVVELGLGVGAASSVSLAWGDGSLSTVAPVNGSAAFKHTYAASGPKNVLATVVENGASKTVAYRIDLAAGTMSRDTAVAAQIKGSSAKDRLTGDDFADRLAGGYGNDVLAGGAGRDIFVFDAKLGTAKTDRKKNFDRITDFNVKNDSVWLDNKYFKKLGKGSESKPGKLKKAFFEVGTKAGDKNDYLVYNKKTGVLSYDADGSGSKQAIEFTQLKKNLKLSYKDFFVI